MTPNKKISYIKSTLKFCIAGLFIPGFTAIVILSFQMGLELLGIECSTSWTVLWILTTVGMATAPAIFIQQINKRLSEGYNLTTNKLMIFNIIEYTLTRKIIKGLDDYLTTGDYYPKTIDLSDKSGLNKLIKDFLGGLIIKDSSLPSM